MELERKQSLTKENSFFFFMGFSDALVILGGRGGKIGQMANLPGTAGRFSSIANEWDIF